MHQTHVYWTVNISTDSRRTTWNIYPQISKVLHYLTITYILAKPLASAIRHWRFQCVYPRFYSRVHWFQSCNSTIRTWHYFFTQGWIQRSAMAELCGGLAFGRFFFRIKTADAYRKGKNIKQKCVNWRSDLAVWPHWPHTFVGLAGQTSLQGGGGQLGFESVNCQHAHTFFFCLKHGRCLLGHCDI